jgi:hypothetical protein
VQRPKRLLHQCAYRTGRDHHHVLELPRVVSNEQDAVAQVWQQEQGRWLQDQVEETDPAMSRTELVIQLIKVALGFAIGTYFVWWSLEVLQRLPPH